MEYNVDHYITLVCPICCIQYHADIKKSTRRSLITKLNFFLQNSH